MRSNRLTLPRRAVSCAAPLFSTRSNATLMDFRAILLVITALFCRLHAESPSDEFKKFADMLALAEAGGGEAQTVVGVMYEIGRGAAKDDAQAAKWYGKAAEQGISEAQFNLALLYKNGRGVPKDFVKTLDLLRKAAGQGNAKAQFNLGVMYEKGQGVQKNDAEAVQWFAKAAEQGDATAQVSLGFMYATGKGVKRNDVEAYKWWLIAAAQGHPDAKKNCEILERNLKSAQMLGAKLSAENFKPRKTPPTVKQAPPK